MDRNKAVSHEEIAERAYELYLKRDAEHGHHEDDWLLAEAQLLEERVRSGEIAESKKSKGASGALAK